MKMKYKYRNREYSIRAKAPKGFTEIKGAMTAPIGTAWYSNNKSLFSGKRKKVLVITDKKQFLGTKIECNKRKSKQGGKTK